MYYYDENDRLLRVTNPIGDTTTYTYDGDGKRVRLESRSGGTMFIYDGNEVLAEMDATGVLQAAYTRIWWVSVVDNGKTWDFKAECSPWRNVTFNWHGTPVNARDLGNIHYGYVGRVVFSKLKLVAGGAVNEAYSLVKSGDNPFKYLWNWPPIADPTTSRGIQMGFGYYDRKRGVR